MTLLYTSRRSKHYFGEIDLRKRRNILDPASSSVCFRNSCAFPNDLRLAFGASLTRYTPDGSIFIRIIFVWQGSGLLLCFIWLLHRFLLLTETRNVAVFPVQTFRCKETSGKESREGTQYNRSMDTSFSPHLRHST
jgi:hypothetical protein